MNHLQAIQMPPALGRILCLVVFLASLTPSGLTALGQSAPPSAEIDNGLIHAKLYLPDPAIGYYRGTRFDWSGVIGSLTYTGHSFYGPWFTRTDPSVRDFIYKGQDIVAGAASAITGPAEEFILDGAALGYAKAPAGGTFIKIGVGILRKPDSKEYSSYHPYEMVDSGKWTVKSTPRSIEFTQRLLDPATGYGYVYRKIVRLNPGSPVMYIEHILQNIGSQPIETNTYNHNFLVLDHQSIGPDFTVTVPFAIQSVKPYDPTLGTVDKFRITYRKPLEGEHNFVVRIAGFSKSAKDYNIKIDNSHVGAGMTISGDRPLAEEQLWSIRSVLAMEPFIHLTIAPGQKTAWTYTYTYRATPTVKQ